MRHIFILLATAAALLADHGTSEKRSLNMEGARQAIAGARKLAAQLKTTGVIAVVDDGGNLMALERFDGTFAAGANISIGKARTAALFKKPTRAFEEIIGKGRTSMVALNDFTPLVGGVPIVIDGQIVGATGVSGAASAQQDEELAMAAANAVQSEARAEVVFFDNAKVSAAFDKGAVLFDGGDKYMVHASRREQPGMVEVHDRDADIVYVLEGSATIVTGGKLLDGKMTAADEVRGTRSEGGESRELKPGDVMIVPAGIPHQFTRVSNPFKYYVVKAR